MSSFLTRLCTLFANKQSHSERPGNDWLTEGNPTEVNTGERLVGRWNTGRGRHCSRLRPGRSRPSPPAARKQLVSLTSHHRSRVNTSVTTPRTHSGYKVKRVGCSPGGRGATSCSTAAVTGARDGAGLPVMTGCRAANPCHATFSEIRNGAAESAPRQIAKLSL